MSGREGKERSPKGAALAVTALALFARLAFVVLTADRGPVFDKYLWLAEKLAAAGWLPEVVFADCPLYIYIMSVLHGVAGLDEPGVRILQSFVGAATVWLLWTAVRRIASERAAIAAAAVLALYPTVILYDTQLMPFVWINFMNAGALCLLFRYRDGRKELHLALAGVVLGLSILLRPNALLLIPFLLLWTTLLAGPRAWPAAIRTALVFLAPLALTVAPVTLVNTFGGGDFVLVTASGGLNIFGGNNPESSPLLCTAFPIVRREQSLIMGDTLAQPITPEHVAYRRIAGQLAGRNLSASDTSSWWTGEALDYVRDYPARFATGIFLKLRHFFHSYEAHDTSSAYMRGTAFGIYPAIFISLAWASGLLGVFLSLRHWRSFIPLYGLLLVYLASVLIFYVSSRLRLPVSVALSAFAGVGIDGYWSTAAKGRSKKLYALSLLLFASALLLILPTRYTLTTERSLRSYNYHFEPAKALFLRGERERALTEFEKALAISPPGRSLILSFLAPYGDDPLVRRFKGTVLYQSWAEAKRYDPKVPMKQRMVELLNGGDHRGVIETTSAILDRYGRDWEAFYFRAVSERNLGLWKESLADLERSYRSGKRLQPGLHSLLYEMGDTAARAGDRKKAIGYARHSLFVRPGFRPAEELLGSLGN